MNVYLIGMPGSGKSEVGKLAAASMEREFVDLDALIEEEAGTDVATVFRREGELGFRRRERAALQGTIDRGELVVACGGGTILDEENRWAMNASGIVIWLSVDAAVLEDRIDFDGSRPLLKTPEDLTRLLAEREHTYRVASDEIIDASGEPEAVAADVARAVKR